MIFAYFSCCCSCTAAAVFGINFPVQWVWKQPLSKLVGPGLGLVLGLGVGLGLRLGLGLGFDLGFELESP